MCPVGHVMVQLRTYSQHAPQGCILKMIGGGGGGGRTRIAWPKGGGGGGGG